MKRQKLKELAKLELAVDNFSKAMKLKLKEKVKETFSGWYDPDNKKFLEVSLIAHAKRLVDNNDPEEVDVANIAMMLWYQRKLREENKHGQK